MSKQFQLLKAQRYRPFFFTQFFGAFNDNVFKTALIALVAFQTASLTDMDGSMLATVLPGIFILPFFLFSATAGQIADKFEKSKLIRIIKACEIGIMLIASAGFFLSQIWLLVTSLFMMGMHSAFFGPVKYSYLPQHLKKDELVGGNGMIEMGTFIAILLGQILGAWLITQSGHALLTSIAILLIATIGYWHSRSIPHSPASDASIQINWNPLSETMRSLKQMWEQQTIWLAIIAISWFWFYGATLLAQFPNLAKDVLHGDESLFITLLFVFSLGIGLGSLLCEKLSHGKSALGLVLIGAIGLSVFGFDLYSSSTSIQAAGSAVTQNYLSFASTLSHWRLLADIAFIGLFGGFYIVPLYVLLQTEAQAGYQSRVIAANNIMNALFMVVSAGFSLLIFNAGFSIPQLFLATAILNALVMVYLCIRQPAYLRCFMAWFKRSE
jgi:MFS family permease